MKYLQELIQYIHELSEKKLLYFITHIQSRIGDVV